MDSWASTHEQSQEQQQRSAFERHHRDYLKLTLERFIHLHYGRYISTSITIIRSRPHSHQLFIKQIFVPLHHQLVRSTYQIETICLIELHSNAIPSPTSLTLSPPKTYPQPRGFDPHPVTLSSGSDHRRSHIPPS